MFLFNHEALALNKDKMVNVIYNGKLTYGLLEQSTSNVNLWGIVHIVNDIAQSEMRFWAGDIIKIDDRTVPTTFYLKR